MNRRAFFGSFLGLGGLLLPTTAAPVTKESSFRPLPEWTVTYHRTDGSVLKMPMRIPDHVGPHEKARWNGESYRLDYMNKAHRTATYRADHSLEDRLRASYTTGAGFVGVDSNLQILGVG
jgi:hypothetical protein